MKTKFALIFVLVLLLSLSVSAQDSAEFLTLDVLQPAAVIGACEEAEFVFELGNFGEFVESYSISVDNFAEDTFLSENPVVLEPNQVKKISVFVKPKCNVYGLHRINLDITNEALGSTYSDSLELEIDSANIPVIAEGIDTLSVNYDKNALQVPIRNIGDVDTTYVLFLEGEPWMTLQETEVTIEAKQVGTVTLISSPLESTEENIYDLTFVAKVKDTGVEYGKQFTVSLAGPTMLESLVAEHGNIVYFVIFGVILLLLIIFVVAMRLYANRDERALRKEEKQKEKELKRLEKEQAKEAKRLEKEQARLEKERLKEEKVQAKIAAREAKLREKEEARLNREKEAEEKRLSKQETWIARKKEALKHILYKALRREFLYINKEDLVETKPSKIPFLILILAIIVAAVGGWFARFILYPYRFYLIGAVAIVVLIAVVYLLYRRLRMQKLFALFEERGEFDAVEEEAKADLSQMYYLLRKEDVYGLASTKRVVAPLIFAVIFLLAGTAVGLFYRQVGFEIAVYAIFGFGLLAFVFFVIFLAKVGAKKKSMRLFKLKQLTSGRSYPLMISSRLGFGELILRVKNSVICTYLAVHHYTRLPVFVAPTNLVFRSFELMAAGMTEKDIDKSTIRFSVPRRWLKKNEIDEDKVKLERYSNNRWVGITECKIIHGDDKSVTYEAVHSGLGLLAITGKTGTVKAEVKKKDNIVKKKTKPLKTKKTAPKKEKKGDKSWLGWVMGFAFLLILLAIVGIVVSSFIGSDTVSGNTNDISKATDNAEDLTDDIAGIDPATVENGIEPIVFTAGESYVIDLDNYFSDPDGDSLEFSFRSAEKLDVSFEGSVARITNKGAESGKDLIVFIATDSSGENIESNGVLVTINKPAGFAGIEYFFAGPLGYILLGIAIVILIVLGLELRKRLHSDDEELELDEDFE